MSQVHNNTSIICTTVYGKYLESGLDVNTILSFQVVTHTWTLVCTRRLYLVNGLKKESFSRVVSSWRIKRSFRGQWRSWGNKNVSQEIFENDERCLDLVKTWGRRYPAFGDVVYFN